MKREVSGSRRTFLKTAAFFSGFVAFFTLGKRVPFAYGPPVPQQSRTGKGYRLTEHIKRYYETARM